MTMTVPLLMTMSGFSGWRVGFRAGAGVALVILAPVAAWLPNDSRRPADVLHLRTALRAYRPLARDFETLRLYACTVTRPAAWVGPVTYLGVSLRNQFGLTTSETGMGWCTC
jgi:predicted MFS family arabinose efflux permease